MLLAQQYVRSLKELIDEIEKTQVEKIDEAARIIAQRVSERSVVHIFDNGHLLSNEAVERAGGLMLMIPLKFTVTVNNPARERGVSSAIQREEGLVKYMIDKSQLQERDVLIINSVSGNNVRPVDLALEAKRRGVYLITITSLAYSKAHNSLHSSSKRLFEVADLVIDNCGEEGDALLEVQGLEPKICPSSGVTAAIIIWMLTAQITVRLLELGIVPSVYKSMGLGDDALNFNNQQLERYKEKGY